MRFSAHAELPGVRTDRSGRARGRERLWQIGIDVREGFRGRRIGAALTVQIARHALELDRVPWYGVAPANLPSLNTALAAGFRLTWLEVFTAVLDPPSAR